MEYGIMNINRKMDLQDVNYMILLVKLINIYTKKKIVLQRKKL